MAQKKQDAGVAAMTRDFVKPHIDSFDYFVEHGLQQAALRIRPIELFQPANNCRLRLWIERPMISPPLKDDRETSNALDQRLRPSECRQAGLSYKGHFTSDICYQWNDKAVMRFSTSFGQVPVMVMSSICHLRGADQKKLVASREEVSEAGGYFICNGHERIIRMLIITKRNHVVAVSRSAYRNRGPGYTDMGVLIRCVRPDQSSVTVRLYYMNHGSATLGFSYRRQEFLIPVGIILKALSHTQDREIFELLAATYDEGNKGKRGAAGTQLVYQRAQIILEEVRQIGLFTRMHCLEYLGERFRPITEGIEDQPAVLVGERIIEDNIFVHLDTNLDKFNLLIFMLQKLFALADRTAAADNMDALQHQEILLPGHLLTMYAKERMQDWLSRVRSVMKKELEEKPSDFDLQDEKKVQKLMDKVPASSIGKRFEYLLNTGNLALKHNVELMQSTGYTIVADRLNYLRYTSHFCSVHRGAYFQGLRTTTVRKLLPESWGFLCPVHTPDGTPCGLLNHLTMSCEITSDMEGNGALKDYLRMRKEIVSVLCSHGMVVIAPGLARCSAPGHLCVLLDGRVVGHIEASRVPLVVMRLRQLKAENPEIPADLEVAHVPCTFAGAYPGLFLFTGSARMIRPVQQLFEPYLNEMIGPFEQVYMDISCPDGIDGGQPDVTSTHVEISPIAMLSMVAGLTPWSDHNQSPRNMYQCQMGKQTMGFPCQTIQFRADNKLFRLQTPQAPLAQTTCHAKYHLDEFPTGTNAIVAVLSYTGYDMEDAMIINKSSMERGLCHGQIYKTEIVDLTKLNKKGDQFVIKVGRSTDKKNIPNAEVLDIDGLPFIGQMLKGDEPYCSVENTTTGAVNLLKIKSTETAVVDYVAAIGSGPKNYLQKVVIRLRQERNPVIGDKFSSRHGQKGICSQLWPDVDMPFSHSTGMRPDIIINPHAFPSRMTIGMLLESMAAKAGALEGKFVDATPFKDAMSLKSERGKASDEGNHQGTVADEYGKLLRAHGFNYHGTEVMYSGIFGTELVCEIYVGVVYYQRLRHMVSDKFQVRSRGAVNPVTQQPVKGRSAGGGIRFGEMERDSLLAHGAAFLLHDRMHTCSDYHIASVCSLCGSLIAPMADTRAKTSSSHVQVIGGTAKKAMCNYCNTGKGIEKVAMPFAFRYLSAELAAMNVKLTLKVSDDLRNTGS